MPVGVAAELAAVVVVAEVPVGGVKGGFVECEDFEEALFGGGVWRAGEDHAVVEEDGCDGGCHVWDDFRG